MHQKYRWRSGSPRVTRDCRTPGRAAEDVRRLDEISLQEGPITV
jgi:hypothetical protein